MQKSTGKFSSEKCFTCGESLAFHLVTEQIPFLVCLWRLHFCYVSFFVEETPCSRWQKSRKVLKRPLKNYNHIPGHFCVSSDPWGTWSRAFNSYISIYFFSQHAVSVQKGLKQLLINTLESLAQVFVSQSEQKVAICDLNRSVYIGL